MAVTIIKTIGTAVGRDYTTPAAWYAGEQGNLVTLDEVHIGDMYKDSVFTTGVTMGGSFSSATQYMHLRAAPGQEHLGVPGAGVVVAVNGQNVIDVQDAFAIVEGLEIDGGAVQSNGNKQGIKATGQNCIARSNIVHGLYAKRNYDSARGIEARNSGGVEVYNNLVYDIKNPTATASTAETYGIKGVYSNSKIYHNTVIDVANPLSTPEGSVGVSIAGPYLLFNNAVMDIGGLDYFKSGFVGTSNNNMDSDGSSPGTLNQQNKLSGNQFVNTAGNDYHLKAGSSAISNGTPVPAVTVDIAGNARDAVAPDIGCFEFVISGGPIINHYLRGY